MSVPTGTARVISADCHVNEPPHVFDAIPAAFRDRAPKLLRGDDGGDGWSFDGGPPKRTLGVEATAGQAVGKMSGLRFDEILPGNYDGTAHVADMDLDGIDVSIVYPANAIHVYVEPDRELALHCTRSYNDWILDEFQAADPARLVGLPMLPVDDGANHAAAIAEVDRCLPKGAKGFFIPGFPSRPYHDPSYDALFAHVAEAGVPLTFHRTFGGTPPAEDRAELINLQVTTAGTVHRFFSAVRPFTYLVFGGVFERHPGLKIVGAEVNFGWLPFWAQTMEQNLDVRSALNDAALATRPTDHLGRNLFVTVLDDHVGFDLVRSHPWMADAAMFSTDYPHSVCLWPRSREHVATLTAGLDPDASHKILAGNAARVYGV